jgi:hypothetical protein
MNEAIGHRPRVGQQRMRRTHGVRAASQRMDVEIVRTESNGAPADRRHRVALT